MIQQKLTTEEMEIALMKELNVRQNIIIPNISYGMDDLHECDLLVLRKSGWADEIEIKISKADFKNDKRKKHDHTHQLIRDFYFAVPEWMEDFSLANVPKKAGLMIVRMVEVRYDGHIKIEPRIKITKRPNSNPCARKWTDKEIIKLGHLGCMRIYSLKVKLSKLKHDSAKTKEM